MILALDLATVTGYAYRDNNGVIQSGYWDMTTKKGEWRDKRYWEIDDLIDVLMQNEVADCLNWENEDEDFGDVTIWYEEPTPQGVNSAKVLYGLLGVVKKNCYEYGAGINVDKKNRGVHPTTLKKWATGSGGADKDDMIDMANDLAGHQTPMITDHNEADAVCLLMYAEAHTENACPTKENVK